jgi:hypothetical protein
MVAGLCSVLGERGVLVLSVVDGLAIGLPIGPRHVEGCVLLDRDGVVVLPPPPPDVWQLASLLDPQHIASDRFERLRALGVAGAANAAAAILADDGQFVDASACADDGEAGELLRAFCDLSTCRFTAAQRRLRAVHKANPRSWLCAWLLGETAAHASTTETRRWQRLTLELLEGSGTAPAELVSVLHQLDADRVMQSCRRGLRNAPGLWHRS